MDGNGTHRRLSPFSAVLVMAALSLIGIASLPRLRLQYLPAASGRTLTVSYALPGASPEVMEAEVTSKIEGVLSGLAGCTDISSVSGKGTGSVSLTFRKGTDMEAARFEVASAIRNVSSALPTGLVYPEIFRSADEKTPSIVLSYIVKGDLPSQEIGRFVRDRVAPALSALREVDQVRLSGATPFQWVITFDAARTAAAGVTGGDIARAFTDAHSGTLLGMTETADGDMAVRLSAGVPADFGSIPVKKTGGQVLHLRDLAYWRYEEALPDSYYRVNGLNTVTLSVGITDDANLVAAAGAVRRRMRNLQASFPADITATLAYDASEQIGAELRKICLRTGLCILILLLFVLLVYRSWRYMLIIVSTLTVNVLTALALYAAAGLRIHVYTLAGITVSMGIVIDLSIMMIDHYARRRDRTVFPSLFAATATTIGALIAVLLLPERERVNLTDFIGVTVINLSLALTVAWFFIPSLMSFLPLRKNGRTRTLRQLRRTVRRNVAYRRGIAWGIRHRWVFVLLFIAGFGIPLCVLPEERKSSVWIYEKKDDGPVSEVLKKVTAWKPYARRRPVIDKWAGSSFALFYKAMDRSNFYRQPTRRQLHIRAGLLEGATVGQLNEVVKSMENFLAGFEEISVYTTSVRAYDDALITVEFHPEYEYTEFPSWLKSEVTAMAVNFGGANWSVYGIDDKNFNNHVVSTYKAWRISVKGYNFREVMRYARLLTDRLSANPRVSGPEIWTAGDSRQPATEFNLHYDFGRMTVAGINPYAYYGVLSSLLFDRTVGSVMTEGERTDVVLRSSDSGTYDLWHVLHAPVSVDSLKVTLAGFGDIRKRRTEVAIRRENQSYTVDVCYDFVGNYDLGCKVTDEAVAYFNDEVLPVGFKAEAQAQGWFVAHKERYAWLLFLIIAILYGMLAMALESFRLPLAVLFMVPISFIGLFLVFGLSDFAFDQGGFAALVMLCGIVVNAGIYLVSTFRRKGGEDDGTDLDRRIFLYVKSFNEKIIPILLTVVSTVLGLLPFLSDGPEEVFWFDFAAGTIGGLLFSMIALLVFLPVFAVRRKDRERQAKKRR